jgi:hypothetical protein
MGIRSWCELSGAAAVGYYPFCGFNGFLLVRGQELILNDHVPYSFSRAQLSDAVRHALKQ